MIKKDIKPKLYIIFNYVFGNVLAKSIIHPVSSTSFSPDWFLVSTFVYDLCTCLGIKSNEVAPTLLFEGFNWLSRITFVEIVVFAVAINILAFWFLFNCIFLDLDSFCFGSGSSISILSFDLSLTQCGVLSNLKFFGYLCTLTQWSLLSNDVLNFKSHSET